MIFRIMTHDVHTQFHAISDVSISNCNITISSIIICVSFLIRRGLYKFLHNMLLSQESYERMEISVLCSRAIEFSIFLLLYLKRNYAFNILQKKLMYSPINIFKKIDTHI